MKIPNLNLWYVSFALKGLVAMVVSGILMFFLEMPDVVDTFLDYIYLLAMTAFYAGALAVLNGIWRYFFGGSGTPNYVYRPKKQFILVRYSTCPFEIERNGIQIWVGMVLDAELRYRQITLRETVSSPRSLFKKDYFMGTAGDDVFVTEDGQKLHLTRGIFGIRVSWEEEENPWKIVAE